MTTLIWEIPVTPISVLPAVHVTETSADMEKQKNEIQTD